MEGVEHGQGIMSWTPKSGFTDHECVTNANPEITGRPLMSYLLRSPSPNLDLFLGQHRQRDVYKYNIYSKR